MSMSGMNVGSRDIWYRCEKDKGRYCAGNNRHKYEYTNTESYNDVYENKNAKPIIN